MSFWKKELLGARNVGISRNEILSSNRKTSVIIVTAADHRGHGVHLSVRLVTLEAVLHVRELT